MTWIYCYRILFVKHQSEMGATTIHCPSIWNLSNIPGKQQAARLPVTRYLECRFNGGDCYQDVFIYYPIYQESKRQQVVFRLPDIQNSDEIGVVSGCIRNLSEQKKYGYWISKISECFHLSLIQNLPTPGGQQADRSF